jgi:hypothetical protein
MRFVRPQLSSSVQCVLTLAHNVYVYHHGCKHTRPTPGTRWRPTSSLQDRLHHQPHQRLLHRSLHQRPHRRLLLQQVHPQHHRQRLRGRQCSTRPLKLSAGPRHQETLPLKAFTLATPQATLQKKSCTEFHSRQQQRSPSLLAAAVTIPISGK